MKKLPIILLLLVLIAFIACKQPASEETTLVEEIEETVTSEAPDYAAFDNKVSIIRAFVKAHSAEDLAKLSEILADTLTWSPPYYNENKYLAKEDYMAVLKNYHDNFENIAFTEGITLPSGEVEPGFWSAAVYPEDKASVKPASIRTYGTWTAKHTESGKDIGVKWYGIFWMNADGKISNITEFWDVNGIAAQIAAE